jgi:hypothetical protein
MRLPLVWLRGAGSKVQISFCVPFSAHRAENGTHLMVKYRSAEG